MDSRSWLHPLTGVLFIVVVIVTIVVSGGEPPSAIDDGVQEVIDHYVDNKESAFLSGILAGAAGALLIFYGAYLFKRMRAAGAEASAAVILVGSAVLAVALAIDGTITVALSESAEDLEPSTVETLAALWENDFVPIAMGLSTFLWGAAVAILRHGALPKWMGWVVAIGAITAISPVFPVAAIIAALFVLVSSIMFALEERAGTSA